VRAKARLTDLHRFTKGRADAMVRGGVHGRMGLKLLSAACPTYVARGQAGKGRREMIDQMFVQGYLLTAPPSLSRDSGFPGGHAPKSALLIRDAASQATTHIPPQGGARAASYLGWPGASTRGVPLFSRPYSDSRCSFAGAAGQGGQGTARCRMLRERLPARGRNCRGPDGDLSGTGISAHRHRQERL